MFRGEESRTSSINNGEKSKMYSIHDTDVKVLWIWDQTKKNRKDDDHPIILYFERQMRSNQYLRHSLSRKLVCSHALP